MNNVIINPVQDSYAKAFSEESIIHKDEYQRVKEIIKSLKQYNIDNKYKDDLNYFKNPRFYNTITISGSRGTGKTSFILSLLNDKEVIEGSEILPVIDPTLIEDKGNIFLNIIERIKERVDDNLSKRGLSATDFEYREWHDSLKDLAIGLPMIDGIADGVNGSDWNDETYVMLKGLNKVQGANNLEFNFRKYVYQSLKILKKNEFIIAFDDIDTDFTKGWPVLELLRKYFTTPQIISIISGDMSLYTLLVRKKQWNNFGKALLKNEYDNKVENYSRRYDDLVYQLASQYLLKVLKTDKRVPLASIRNLIFRAHSNYLFSIKTNDGTVEDLITFYRKILSEWNITGSNINDYIYFFLDLPIRTQISLMSYYTGDFNPTSEGMARNITDVFYAELQQMRVDVWSLFNDHENINVSIVKLLIENDILDEGSLLLPTVEDQIKDAALTAMGVVFVNGIKKKKSGIFDYIIRIANLVDKLGRLASNQFEYLTTEFINYSQVLLNSGDKKIASLQCAYMVASGSRYINDGLIPLYGLFEKSRKKNQVNRIDEVFHIYNPGNIKDYLAMIPLVSFQFNNGDSRLCYSFYNIVGTIADLLSFYEQNVISSNSLSDPSMMISQLKVEFLSLSQFRTYRVNKEGILSDEEYEEYNDNLPVIEEQDSLTEMIQSLYDWMKLNDEIKIPPYLLGRIMVRTNYSFNNIKLIEDESLFDVLHRQLVCFLNAVLVEEAMEKGHNDINLSNPTGTDDVYKNNLRDLSQYLGTFCLFNYITTCPLVKCYLDADIKTDVDGTSFSDDLHEVKIQYNPRHLSLSKRRSNNKVKSVLLDDVIDDIGDRIMYSADTRYSYRRFALYCIQNNISKGEIIDNEEERNSILKEVYLGFSKKKYKENTFTETIMKTTYMLRNKQWE